MVKKMKRFITKRKIKMPQKQLIIIFLMIGIVSICLINIIINNMNEDKIMSVLIYDSYGNFLENNLDRKTIFYKSIYGLDFNQNSSESVMKSNYNLEELIIENKPLIYLYNTNQTDTYQGKLYNNYNISPVITQANYILKEYLEQNSIPVLVETQNISDVLKENNLSPSNIYRASRIWLEQRKEEYPSLEYFIDIGMSNDNYKYTTALINEEKYAKVLFIIGTENPHYQENQILAMALEEKIKKIDPNLSRGISLQGGSEYQGIYNEDFSSNTLFINIGGKENTIDEVNRTLNILAQVIKEYLSEVSYEEK